MANRKSRYDSLTGFEIQSNLPDFDSVMILNQVLGKKFIFSSFKDGVATFVFENR